MAKYQFKIEVEPPEDEAPSAVPTIETVATALEAGLALAFPDAEVRAYDGERSDAD